MESVHRLHGLDIKGQLVEMKEEPIKLADLPAKWEAEAAEIDDRIEKGEVSGEIWEARRDILTENAVDLREALYRHKHTENSTDHIPSSVYRLAEWLGGHAYPHDPEPETNDICDWALALLIQQDRTLQTVPTTASN